MADMMLPEIPINPRYSVMVWFLTRNSWATLPMAYITEPARQSRSPRRGLEPREEGEGGEERGGREGGRE